MALSTNNMQATGSQNGFVVFFPLLFNLLNLRFSGVFQLIHFRLPVTAQYNISTTACHVGCNCYRSGTTGLRNDIGFLSMELGVQYFMRDLFFFQNT